MCHAWRWLTHDECRNRVIDLYVRMREKNLIPNLPDKQNLNLYQMIQNVLRCSCKLFDRVKTIQERDLRVDFTNICLKSKDLVPVSLLILEIIRNKNISLKNTQLFLLNMCGKHLLMKRPLGVL